MIGGEIETRIVRVTPLLPMQEAAISYLTRTGNADLLPILGLAEDEERAAPLPRGYHCAVCENPLPSHGVCRKSARCREVATEFTDQLWARRRAAS